MKVTFEHSDLSVRLTTDALISTQISKDNGCVYINSNELELLRDILNTILNIIGDDR